jgi:ribonuclease VapC
MAIAVLDTSAFLALFKNESGADRVIAVMHDCVMSSLNAAEVLTKLAEWGMPPDLRDQAFALIPAIIIDFDMDLARATGDLRTQTKLLGLSLGDRACLALARREGLPALTADQAWSKADVGVSVTLVR